MESSSDKVDSVVELYRAIMPTGDEELFPDSVEEDLTRLGFRPRLRIYQRRTLAWMLRRETQVRSVHAPIALQRIQHGTDHATARAMWKMDHQDGSRRKKRGYDDVHPLWFCVQVPPVDPSSRQLERGRRRPRCLYIHRWSGLAKIDGAPLGAHDVRGGALCDEMGLGKTVEVLACILANRLNRKPTVYPSGPSEALYIDDEEDEDNHQDAEEEGDLIVGTTLIVVPVTLLPQWLRELAKHTERGSLRVGVYQGLGDKQPMSATDIAKYDILLTTYDVLRQDVHRHPTSVGAANMRLRTKKRYKGKYKGGKSLCIHLYIYMVYISFFMTKHPITAAFLSLSCSLQSRLRH